MADMFASAFVANIIKDKKCRDEVIASIPEELMREDEDSIIARANRYVDSYNQHVLS